MVHRRAPCDRSGHNRVSSVLIALDNSLFDTVHHRLLALVMATRKVADHTLYHLSPKGFWKKFSTLGFLARILKS